MRLNLFGAVALASALAAPRTAAADVIDDFTIVGNGVDITFSLPATNVVDVLQSYNHWYATFPEISNGVSQVGSLSIWFESTSCLGDQQSYLAGVRLCSYYPGLWTLEAFVPFLPPQPPPAYAGYAVINWNPGTYLDTDFLDPIGSCPYVGSSQCTYPQYTITITPEAATVGATPEPGTLALLATGLAAGSGVMRRRFAVQ